MRRACIDIGSNTTRLLVAECPDGRLQAVYQERAFTHLGRCSGDDGTIAREKVDEVARVVSDQLHRARELGAVDVRCVATAAIRWAPNGAELAAAVDEICGLEVAILSGEEEARLAFVGAARSLGHVPAGALGVADVGGGSSELVVGTAPDSVSWSASLRVGSADLVERCLRSDPPSEPELLEARGLVMSALDGVEVPQPVEAVAVGGSAFSLARLAGELLDEEALTRALRLLAGEPADAVAQRFGLDAERVRLMPGGLLILQAAAERFGRPLKVGRGGLREGVLLEASGG